MAKPVTGTKKADKITVNADNVIVVTGKTESRYPITKSGKNYIFGVGGNDTIYVKGGKNNYIYGDDKKGKVSGNNKIIISGGTYNIINGGKGADTITVGAKVLGATVFGGAGKDRITVNSTKTYKSKYKGVYEGKTYTQVTYYGTYVDAGSSDDTIVANAGTAHNIYGGKGKDTITVGKKAQAYVDGGAGNDLIMVKSATQGKFIFNGETLYSGTQVDAGSGNDTITITAGKGHTVFTGSGNDAVEIKGGKNGTVTYGSGNNEFTITGGSGYKFESGFIYDEKEEYYSDNYYSKSTEWKSAVSISGGSNNSIYCGNGDDTVVINGGKNNYVDVRDGNDYVEVTGGTNNSVSVSVDQAGIAIGKASVYIKGGTDTSVFSGNGKNTTIYVQGGSFKDIYSEGGTVSLASKVKYGKDASVLSRGNAGNNPVNYRVAWNDTINLKFEGNASSKNDTLTITGVKCGDLKASTEFKDAVVVCTIVGNSGGEMTFKIFKGGWDFANITVGGETFNSKDEFISALL